MKKIVLITTGQPSTNPRIVKEADALHAAGYDVTVLYSFFISWAFEKDKILLQKEPWKYNMLGGCPFEKKSIYLLSRIRSKAANTLNRYLGNSFWLAERTQARAYDELLQSAKKIKADWYIGHNLGALAVAVNAAKHNNAHAGFDFEDYHRGEFKPADKHNIKRIAWLENKYLPGLKYYSTSSEMITAAVRKDHPLFKGKIITLLNSFSLAQQPVYREKDAGDESLQLFWFSQTIGKNRGLEILIKALVLLNDASIHLTLAGRCNDEMSEYLTSNASEILTNIHFAGIIQPEDLPCFASGFDIGLALETGFSKNNNLALSNKIFTYLLAGNAIILSETLMQADFNSSYQIGESFKINDAKALAKNIMYYKNREKLNNQKFYNYELAKNTLNWNKESSKLVKLLARLEAE